MGTRLVPGWLKQRIVPVWNRGYWLGVRSAEYLGAVRHGRFGRCDVCGRFGPWLYQRRVIPRRLEELWGLSPALAEAQARKESSACAWCGAKLRARRIARVILDLFGPQDGTPPPRSLAEWVKTPRARSLRIAEINRVEGLHEFLQDLPELAFSDYQDPEAPGLEVSGARSEDLTQLSYADGAFDLVITSETLEHVPDLSAGLSEIRRVLAPGQGLHVFTVPLLPGVPRTYQRARLREDGSVEELAPMIRHPGGDVGYPVFTEFGADLPEVLNAAGFETTLCFGPVRDDDVAQVWVSRAV